MYYFESDISSGRSMMGKHFMASLLWNTEPNKMLEILEVMMNTYEKYGLPIGYESLGIEEV